VSAGGRGKQYCSPVPRPGSAGPGLSSAKNMKMSMRICNASRETRGQREVRKEGRRDETCPVSTEGGTRRVQLVREGGGRGGVPGRAARPGLRKTRTAPGAGTRLLVLGEQRRERIDRYFDLRAPAVLRDSERQMQRGAVPDMRSHRNARTGELAFVLVACFSDAFLRCSRLRASCSEMNCCANVALHSSLEKSTNCISTCKRCSSGAPLSTVRESPSCNGSWRKTRRAH